MTTPVTDTTDWQRWNDATDARATTPVDIIAVGDSITEGAFATTTGARWIEVMRDQLRVRFPVTGVAGGRGYVPASLTVTAPSGGPTVYTSSWSYGGNATPTASYGLGLREVTLTADVGAGTGAGWAQITVSGTSARLHWLRGYNRGKFRVLLDGTVVTALVDTAAGATGTDLDDGGRLTVTFPTRGSHTVRVEWISSPGQVNLAGIMVFDQDEAAGLRLYDCGRGGAQASFFSPVTSVPAQALAADWRLIQPALVLIELGGNEMLNNVPPSTFKANVGAIMDSIRDQCVIDPCFVLVAAFELAPHFATAYTWQQYVTEMRELGDESPRTSFCDLTFLSATAVGATYDGVHPSDSGHTAIAYGVLTHLDLAHQELLDVVEQEYANPMVVRPTGSVVGLTPWLVTSAGAYIPLPHWHTLEVTTVRNGIGTCKMDYPVIGDNYAELVKMFGEDHDLRFEVWMQGAAAGKRWAGYLTDCEGDDIAEDGVWSFSGYSLEMLLDEGIVQPGTSTSYDRDFIGQTAGNMIGILLSEVVTVGGMPGIAAGFSGLVDSDGVSWPSNSSTITFRGGDTLLQALEQLIGLGMIDGFDISPGRVLSMYKIGGQGTDRANLTGSGVILQRGSALLTCDRKYSARASCTAGIAKYGSGDAYVVASNSAAQTRRGRVIETAALNLPGVDVAAQASLYITSFVAARSIGSLELSMSWHITPGVVTPFIDYQQADYLLAQVRASGYERLRVRQMTLSVSRDDGYVQGAVTLASSEYDNATLVAQVLQAVASSLKRGGA